MTIAERKREALINGLCEMIRFEIGCAITQLEWAQKVEDHLLSTSYTGSYLNKAKEKIDEAFELLAELDAERDEYTAQDAQADYDSMIRSADAAIGRK